MTGKTIYEEHGLDWWRQSEGFLSALAKLVPARVRYMDRFVPRWTGLDVLDLGCGGGFMSEALARKGARVVGVDPAKEALHAGVAHARAEGLEISYVAALGEGLPLRDEAFDVVVCVDVMEHLESLPRALSEMARVLRPGGRLFLETVNRNRLSRLVMITLAENVLSLLPRGTHDHGDFIRPRELAGLLTERNFHDVSFRGVLPLILGPRISHVTEIPSTAVCYLGHAVKSAG